MPAGSTPSGSFPSADRTVHFCGAFAHQGASAPAVHRCRRSADGRGGGLRAPAQSAGFQGKTARRAGAQAVSENCVRDRLRVLRRDRRSAAASLRRGRLSHCGEPRAREHPSARGEGAAGICAIKPGYAPLRRGTERCGKIRKTRGQPQTHHDVSPRRVRRRGSAAVSGISAAPPLHPVFLSGSKTAKRFQFRVIARPHDIAPRGDVAAVSPRDEFQTFWE